MEENQRSQIYLWDGNAAGFYDEGEESPQYYLQEELGSPLRIEGEDGRLRESCGYDEFGCDLYGNQGKVQPFGYTGYQQDTVAGTYFAQAREYRVDVGQFLPRDKNRYKKSFNTMFSHNLANGETRTDFDYRNTITHEMGHVFGLDDVMVDNHRMESFVSNIDIQMLLLAAKTGEWQYYMDYLGNIQSTGAQTYEMCEDD